MLNEYLFPDTTSGTAIFASIGVVWGGQCKHLYGKHGVFGIDISCFITSQTWMFDCNTSLRREGLTY